MLLFIYLYAIYNAFDNINSLKLINNDSRIKFGLYNYNIFLSSKKRDSVEAQYKQLAILDIL